MVKLYFTTEEVSGGPSTEVEGPACLPFGDPASCRAERDDLGIGQVGGAASRTGPDREEMHIPQDREPGPMMLRLQGRPRTRLCASERYNKRIPPLPQSCGLNVNSLDWHLVQ